MKKMLLGAALGGVCALACFSLVMQWPGTLEILDGSRNPELDEARFYDLHDKTMREVIDGKLSREGAVERLEMAAKLFRPLRLQRDLAEFEGTRRERLAQYLTKLLGQPGQAAPTCDEGLDRRPEQ